MPNMASWHAGLCYPVACAACSWRIGWSRASLAHYRRARSLSHTARCGQHTLGTGSTTTRCGVQVGAVLAEVLQAHFSGRIDRRGCMLKRTHPPTRTHTHTHTGAAVPLLSSQIHSAVRAHARCHVCATALVWAWSELVAHGPHSAHARPQCGGVRPFAVRHKERARSCAVLRSMRFLRSITARPHASLS